MSSKLRLLAFILILSLTVGMLTACAPDIEDIPPVQTADITPDEPDETDANKPNKYADEIFSLNCDFDEGFDPYTAGGSFNGGLMPLMYEGLFRVSSDFTAEKVLCEDFYTDDGRVYRIDVKQGIKFHDGSELTPADVAASIERARVSANYSARLSIITAAYVLEDTVFIELTRPNYNLPLLLDVPVTKFAGENGDIPIGTGPYYYVDAGDYSYLRAFDEHRERGELPIERFYLKEYSGSELITAFDSGLIDIVTTSKADVNYLEYSGNTESRKKNTTIFYFLGVNSSNEFLSVKNRRVLLSSMIDRQSLSEDVITAVPVTIPLHPEAKFYSEGYDPFTVAEENIEAAKIEFLVEDYDHDGLLEYMDLDEGIVDEISLKLIVNKENPTKLKAAYAIKEDLAGWGIHIVVSELTWNSYIRALKNKDYDLYYGEVMLTADFDLTQLLCYGGNANYGLYDPTLQSLIYDFNASAEDKKLDSAALLYSYIAENLPIISLMFEIETVYTHRETVSGIEPTIHNLFNDIGKWKINIG